MGSIDRFTASKTCAAAAFAAGSPGVNLAPGLACVALFIPIADAATSCVVAGKVIGHLSTIEISKALWVVDVEPEAALRAFHDVVFAVGVRRDSNRQCDEHGTAEDHGDRCHGSGVKWGLYCRRCSRKLD